MPNKAEVLTPTESRQASSRRLNFRVLVGSMLMVVVVAAVLYAFVYGYPESTIGMPETPPAASDNPAPAPTMTP
jgi:cytochrome c-type biogenesis protein CcmH/NrfG